MHINSGIDAGGVDVSGSSPGGTAPERVGEGAGGLPDRGLNRCSRMQQRFRVAPGVSWGLLPPRLKVP